MLCDDIAESEELLGERPRLADGRIVIVAGDVGFVTFLPVGAVHESEAGASVKHVEVDGVSLRENPI